MIRISTVFAAAAAFVGVFSGTAYAAAFGPATAVVSVLTSPTVDLTADTITQTNGSAILYNGTGTLAGSGTLSGTSNGVITFSSSVGTTINETLNGLFSFADGSGGFYVFNANSVQTQTFTNSFPTSVGISLYILGTMGDSNLNLAPTATSFTLSINETGGSSYSEGGTLSNPPTPPTVAPVPEPASMAILGASLIGAGLVRRRRK